jgi:hypothetical protein
VAPADPEESSSLAIVKAAPEVAPGTAPGVSAGVGFSLLGRTLGFDVASAPGYHGGTIAGVRVEGAVFPLALSSELASAHPALASFGFAGSYESLFDFSSTTLSGSGKIGGHASRFSVAFVGRIPLGHKAIGGSLVLDTGLTRFSFSHDSQLDVGVPNVRYDMLAAGVGWDRSLGTKWAALAFRLGYLGVLQSGDIASYEEYGRGSGWGLASELSLTAAPLRWLWLRLRASIDHVALSFSGNGVRYARSASDDWLGGALEVGFAL